MFCGAQAGAANQQQQPQVREQHTIWQGVLEWIETAKNPNDPQTLTRHVPCDISANSKDGEPDLKADSWPQKLIMQLMPKQLIGNIGGAYLKNSKSVLFHPQNCEALDSLTKVMSSGFGGCVLFTSVPSPSSCNIKVLILLYTMKKHAYIGFIPNDQTAFVDRLREVIQHQKNAQELIRQQEQSQACDCPTELAPSALTMTVSPTHAYSAAASSVVNHATWTRQDASPAWVIPCRCTGDAGMPMEESSEDANELHQQSGAINIQHQEHAQGGRKITSSRKRKITSSRKREIEEDIAMKTAMQLLTKWAPDEHDIFAQNIALEIRSLKSDSVRRNLKLNIRQAILNAAEEDNAHLLSSATSSYSNSSSGEVFVLSPEDEMK